MVVVEKVGRWREGGKRGSWVLLVGGSTVFVTVCVGNGGLVGKGYTVGRRYTGLRFAIRVRWEFRGAAVCLHIRRKMFLWRFWGLLERFPETQTRATMAVHVDRYQTAIL